MGKLYVNQREVDLVSRSITNLMMLCWQNRYVDLFIIQILYFIRCFSQNISQVVQYLMPKKKIIKLLCLEEHEKGSFDGGEMESWGWKGHSGF